MLQAVSIIHSHWRQLGDAKVFTFGSAKVYGPLPHIQCFASIYGTWLGERENDAPAEFPTAAQDVHKQWEDNTAPRKTAQQEPRSPDSIGRATLG